MADARREAQALIAAAQKSAQELRDADIAATREELARLRDKATADIAADRDRALADLRAQVADLALAAAGVVVGEIHDRRPPAPPRRGFLATSASARDGGTDAAHRRRPALRRGRFPAAERDGTVDAWQRDLARPPGWPATSGSPGPWTARPFRSAERRKAVEQLLGKTVSPGALNLALLLAERGRFAVLPDVSAEYDALVRKSRGIVAATVTTPAPLSAAELKQVTARVEQLAGAKVELATAADPQLIGGLTIRIGDDLIDASVQGRLQRLRGRLVQGTS
jgi:F-type H+-transporting ATPase subunit delta